MSLWSNSGQTRARIECPLCDAMPPIMSSYQGARIPLANLFDLKVGMLVMGTSLGDKIAIVIALLLLAVGGGMIVAFPGIIRALVATL